MNRYNDAKQRRWDLAESRKGSMEGLLEAKFDKRMYKRLKPSRAFRPTKKNYRLRKVGGFSQKWKGCKR